MYTETSIDRLYRNISNARTSSRTPHRNSHKIVIKYFHTHSYTLTHQDPAKIPRNRAAFINIPKPFSKAPSLRIILLPPNRLFAANMHHTFACVCGHALISSEN